MSFHPPKSERQRRISNIEFCKTFQHAMVPVDVTFKPTMGFPMQLRCERCDTVRKDTYDINGDLMSRHYDYPDGYREIMAMSKQARRATFISQHRLVIVA